MRISLGKIPQREVKIVQGNSLVPAYLMFPAYPATASREKRRKEITRSFDCSNGGR
jgi:hypothetical protein